MTNERYNLLMGKDEIPLTEEEMREGWHWCYDFDGLLRNNNEEEYQCDCLANQS